MADVPSVKQVKKVGNTGATSTSNFLPAPQLLCFRDMYVCEHVHDMYIVHVYIMGLYIEGVVLKNNVCFQNANRKASKRNIFADTPEDGNDNKSVIVP